MRHFFERKKPLEPWITENIKRMQKLKNKAFRDYKSTKQPSKWTYYKQLRNLVISSIRLEKKPTLDLSFKTVQLKKNGKN